MVEHIDQQHVIEGAVIVRDALTIEEPDGYPGAGSPCDIDAGDLEPWLLLTEPFGECAVSAAHIEERALLREKPGQVMGERLDPAWTQPGAVDLFCKVHRRLIPNMLTKNPERIVWMPRAARVTPGTTCLRVEA